jgi:hypothetical protein
MPNRTVYIKQLDLDKWEALDNKSAWLHEHLTMPKFSKMQLSSNNTPGVLTEAYLEEQFNNAEGPRATPLMSPKQFKKYQKEVKDKLCEHFQPKGRCLVKGCNK